MIIRESSEFLSFSAKFKSMVRLVEDSNRDERRNDPGFLFTLRTRTMVKVSSYGVYPQRRTNGRVEFVYYALRFDEKGNVRIAEDLVRPRRRRRETATYTDVFVFSHGWNNNW